MGTKLNTAVETISARGTSFISKSAQVMRSIDNVVAGKSREVRGQILMLRASRRRRNKWLREISVVSKGERERAAGPGDHKEEMMVMALEGFLVDGEEEDETLEGGGWLHVQ
jgi:hypothetical protein